MVHGFGIYGLTSAYTNFFVKYKYVVMNTASDEVELEVNNDDVDQQTRVYHIAFENDLIEVPAGTDFTIQMKAYGPNNNYRVRGYYGYNGNNYK